MSNTIYSVIARRGMAAILQERGIRSIGLHADAGLCDQCARELVRQEGLRTTQNAKNVLLSLLLFCAFERPRL